MTLSLATLLCALLALDAVVVVQAQDVTIIDMLHTKNPVLADSIKAYRTGVMAALWSRKNMVAGGRTIRFIEVLSSATESAVQTAIDTAMKKNPNTIAVLGPAGGRALMFSLPALKRYNLVALGPYTGSTEVRRWEPHFYFLRTDPMSGVYAHVWYAIAHLRVRRLGVMYLTDIGYGDKEYAISVRLMREMGYKLCGVFKLPGTREWNVSDAEFQAEWEAFVATRPQAVIIMGRPSPTTGAFVRQAVTDKRTQDMYLQSLLVVQNTLVSNWKAAVEAGASFPASQIVTTGTNPLPTDLRYNAIRRFRAVMKDYLSKSGQNDYKDTECFLTDLSLGETMIDGWIVGEVLAQIFASPELITNRTVFAESLYNQRRYTVDDLVIGDFGGECSGRAASQGAICRCNQGGRSVFIKTFDSNGRAEPMTESEFTYPRRRCYPTSRKVLTPINAVTFHINDSRRARYASAELIYGEKQAVLSSFESQREYTLKMLNGSRKQVYDILRAEARVRLMDIFIGLVVMDTLKVPNLTFVDPFLVYPIPRVVRRDVIYLSPTLDQEFFTLAKYLSASRVTEASAVILSYIPDDIAALLRRTLVAHEIELESVVLHKPGKKVLSDIPKEGWVFVVGASQDAFEPLLEHVRANPDLRVMIASSEHHLFFPQFVNMTVSNATDRILFATNLPHWADPDSSVKLLEEYHTAVPDASLWSPLGLTGFAASRAVMAVADMMDTITAELFADTVYSRAVITTDEMVYGPFRQTDKANCHAASDSQCLVNYGATSIAVWSLSRSINFSIPPLADPITPSMDYTDPNAGKLTRAQLTGVIVGSILGVALLAAAVIVLLCYCRDSRDNRNAPRERTDPVTLVFTDIESSTALWAACPKAMPDAVATHHRLIRSLITKYRCYEVKTIGDSFMIACRSALTAVQLVRDLQQVFVQNDWGTTAIDDAYRAFEEGRAAEDDQYTPPSARLDAAVYRQYWNGLRVRAGVHTGLCDIRHDEVTKGYDYYGDTSNTAARTESVANGGQVLLTRAAYMALSAAEREQIDVTALGAVALRGVPRSVGMYQLNAVPGRTFAALRLDREATNFDVGTESEGHSMSSASNNESSSARENPLASLLTELLNPLSLSQRQKTLQTLCERWGVSVPLKRSSNAKDVCQAATCRLATKLARVIALKVDAQRDETSVGLGAFLGSMGTNGFTHYTGGSFSLDVTAAAQPQNRIWTQCNSISISNSESSMTIVCRQPPNVLL